MDINKIVRAEINTELKNYKTHFKNSLKSEIRILDIISDFVHYKKRSEIIPVLTFLTRKVFAEVNSDTLSAAVLIDLLYTATLIHDDVEDEAIEKHSLVPINTLWKSKLSVLMGDYFLAKGLLLSVKNKSYDLLEIVSNSVKEITEGELYKIYHNRSLNINKEEYLNIISKRLPSLFSACTTSAAILSEADHIQKENLQNYGFGLGMALQLNTELKLLKTKHKNQARLSFPLILALEKSNPEEQAEILSLFAPDNSKDTNAVGELIRIKGGAVSTLKIIEEYKSSALDSISWLKESPVKRCLTSMVQDINPN